jgi:hypothetical protein
MEIWADVKGYEGVYQVSNLGRVKSLDREVKFSHGFRKIKGIVLKDGLDANGYCKISLSYNSKTETKNIHQLVAIAFLNHTPCGMELVIDHINDIKTDNRVENLQIVTQRFNARKTQGIYSSNHRGVAWDKERKKWRALIITNGKNKSLGRFATELEASQAYQAALLTV